MATTQLERRGKPNLVLQGKGLNTYVCGSFFGEEVKTNKKVVLYLISKYDTYFVLCKKCFL
ncbi:hypothetical protein EP04_14205 [Listeria monocytogenes]|nr:hypothetical protein [Listeria monocytogenes]